MFDIGSYGFNNTASLLTVGVGRADVGTQRSDELQLLEIVSLMLELPSIVQ
jgi:hypothetical protein